MEMIALFVIALIAFGKAWSVSNGDFRSKEFTIEFTKVTLWYILVAIVIYGVAYLAQVEFIHKIADSSFQADIFVRRYHRNIGRISEELMAIVITFEGLRQLVMYVMKVGIKYYIKKQTKIAKREANE